ncbi:hypothetical protein [Actinomadura litoris]|uniref:hypothetical protein n=1 Tax=Actinomadura litoris TaxID=2678616 RepID=UPI001FA71EA7|nr:hypothetical protein [Actinomadura litoris]
MLSNMVGNTAENSRTLPDLCADFIETTRRHDWDAAGLAHDAAIFRAQEADTAERTQALAVLAPVLADVALGEGPDLAILAGGLMDLGADPGAALEALTARVAECLELAARFPALWDSAGGAELPSPEDNAQVPVVLDRLNADPDGLALSPVKAGHATEAWFTAATWAQGLLVPLQHREVRDSLPNRERLTAAAETASGLLPAASWVNGLLRVLDDETLIVLHRPTGSGYRLTIGGIGDNFQLHTLLAATLIGGGHIDGTPPDPEWVAAATDGQPRPVGGIEGRFNLVDGHGEWIWNEGRPADIPLLDGHRVIVLDPPPYPRAWDTGRVYPLMRPTITLDHVLTPDEAAGWTARIAPANNP